MTTMSRSNKIQLDYIEKLFDEKLLVVDQKLMRIEEKVDNVVSLVDGNSEHSLRVKVEKHDKWINEMTGKIAIISVVATSVVSLLASFIKNDILKIK